MRMLGAFRGLPTGVYLMFSTEFWERFSYYGFMGILTFFMIAPPAGGGLGWQRADALLLFGATTGTIWIAPTIGGWVADNFIGARKAVLLGCIGLAAGNFLLSAAGWIAAADPAREEAGAAALAVFFLGLITLIIGAGLFKANASALLGELFTANDPRREAGFTLFYMGINLGALVAPLTAGTLGERVGWPFGFLLAGMGMLVGFSIFARLSSRYFRVASTRRALIRPAIGMAFSLKDPAVRLILIMALFAIVFMSGVMQYGGLLNLYAASSVDRRVFEWEIPATWFLTLNPLFVLLLGPVLVAFWNRALRTTQREPLAMKVATGLGLAACAFAILSLAEMLRGAELANPWVLVLFYLVLTAGDLCVLPAGLAEISRRAPASAIGVLMGVWILTMGVGSVIAGWLGALAETMGTLTIFVAMAFAATLAAGLLLSLEPRLRTWTAEPRPITAATHPRAQES